MRVEGEVALEAVVWLTASPEALAARALAGALPTAEWVLHMFDRARIRLRGPVADVEVPYGRRWSGLISGRLIAEASPSLPPFQPYVVEHPGLALLLESCWFAVDLQGHVACFDRDTLGAAPMRRCWGPRPEPIAEPLPPEALREALLGRHGPLARPAPAYTFVADAEALAHALAHDAPPSAARRWSLTMHERDALVAGGLGSVQTEPVSAELLAWLHAHDLCRGCTRASLRDPRLQGIFLYQHQGRARAAPYERVGEPAEPGTVEQVAAALGLHPAALRRAPLPVRFTDKERLQPIEYVRCTWSDTVPWESEAGERHGGTMEQR
jgi:hypothetical protein